MIVWINGTFGVGKTTTAGHLADRDGWRTFDPEHVGYLLAGNLRDHTFDDFQDLPPWRALVPIVADEIHRYSGSEVTVAVQTVLVERYWVELSQGLRDRGLPVLHVVLECDEGELRRRIEGDEVESQAREWRLDHIARFHRARGWLAGSADLMIDTTAMDPATAADRIGEAVADRTVRHPTGVNPERTR